MPLKGSLANQSQQQEICHFKLKKLFQFEMAKLFPFPNRKIFAISNHNRLRPNSAQDQHVKNYPRQTIDIFSLSDV